MGESVVKKKVPTNYGVGLGGCLKELQNNHLKLFYDGYKQYGDFMRFRFASSYSYLLSNPKEVEYVLKDNPEKYTRKTRAYSSLNVLLRNSIGFSGGELWKKQRTTVSKFFTRKNITPKFPKVLQTAQKLSEMFECQYKNNTQFDIHFEMDRAILSSFDKLFLGLGMGEYFSSFIDAKNFLTNSCYWRILKPINIPRFVPTKENRKFNADLKKMKAMVKEIIKRDSMREVDEKNILDYLSVPRSELNNPRCFKQVFSELMGYFLMGHWTSAVSLTWTWYLLAKYPEVEKRLVSEIDSVLNGREIEHGDLDKLNYLDQVIKESLRLYPPAWLLSRDASKTDVVRGYKIVKGASVNICAYIIHRNEEFWKNPEIFDPDRFSQENRKEINMFSYIPFGTGRHVCTGGDIFYMEAKTIIATILQKFRLRLVSKENILPKPAYILLPEKKIMMYLEKR